MRLLQSSRANLDKESVRLLSSQLWDLLRPIAWRTEWQKSAVHAGEGAADAEKPHVRPDCG